MNREAELRERLIKATPCTYGGCTIEAPCPNHVELALLSPVALAAIDRLVIEGRLSTVTSALNACPTKDHMLRKWLVEHKDYLLSQSSQPLADTSKPEEASSE